MHRPVYNGALLGMELSAGDVVGRCCSPRRPATFVPAGRRAARQGRVHAATLTIEVARPPVVPGCTPSCNWAPACPSLLDLLWSAGRARVPERPVDTCSWATTAPALAAETVSSALTLFFSPRTGSIAVEETTRSSPRRCCLWGPRLLDLSLAPEDEELLVDRRRRPEDASVLEEEAMFASWSSSSGAGGSPRPARRPGTSARRVLRAGVDDLRFTLPRNLLRTLAATGRLSAHGPVAVQLARVRP